MTFLNYLMNINFLHGICLMTIYNTEMLEKIKSVQNFVRDKNRNLRSKNVLICRIMFISGVVVVSLFFTDLRLVYAFNGIFLNSVVGLIIPGILAISRKDHHKARDTEYDRIGDLACFAAGSLSILLGVIDLF